MAEVEALKRKRSSLKSRLTKFGTYLEGLKDDVDLTLLQAKLDMLKRHFEDIYPIHEQLVEADAAGQATHQTELDTMEETFCLLCAKVKKRLQGVGGTSSGTTSRNSTPSVAVSCASNSRLPEIRIPHFDGSIEDWRPFRDMFLSKIDSDDKISDVDKLYYLRTYVTGKAARAIDAIECTAENYKSAWKILNDKYDNSRKTILHHWSVLHELPRLIRDTPSALEELTDTFRQHMRALKSLGEPVEHFNSILVFLLLKKISETTRFQWETTLKDNKMPTVDSLLEFLSIRGSCSEFTSRNSALVKTNHNSSHKGKALLVKPNSELNPCMICHGAHPIYRCDKFHAMPHSQRQQAVAKSKVCMNCLQQGHTTEKCTRGSCRKCGAKHNTLLHREDPVNQEQGRKTINSGASTSEAHRAEYNVISNDDIIPTASIYIHDTHKNQVPCRAILDTGSSRNFITHNLAHQLRLPRKKQTIPVGTLNNLSIVSDYSIIATIKSTCSGYQKTLEFLAVPAITSLTPEQQIRRDTLDIPSNIRLADPEFHKPAAVQLLLGAGATLSVLSIGQISLSGPNEPDLVLQKTLLGWIVGGNQISFDNVIQHGRCHLLNLQEDITRFWEIEDGSSSKHISKEEASCEQHFVQHTHRMATGQYVVALPFNDKVQQLGDSYNASFKRLQSLERRFRRQPQLKNQYVEIIHDYLERGYIKKLTNPSSKGYFLPHQAVLKDSSQTTKVRVVFDASAVSSTGVSLNDALLPGPILQDDILTLLLRFRLHNYVLTGDIEKMYLQVFIREEDQRYLRILWQEEDGSVAAYQFERLIFGLKTASFLAIRCLHQLSDDESTRYPKASGIIKRDLYVDDLLTGAATIKEAVKLRQEITSLLGVGGFNIRQFASNSPEVLQSIPETNVNLQLQAGEDTTLKTLGIHWNSRQDAIIYTVKPIAHQIFTKRNICSEIAKIFDPLGLLNPMIVTAKLIMQSLWKLKLDWDETVSADIQTAWGTFVHQLPCINGIVFKRHALHVDPKDVQLHGFCDASEKAYGACFYVRSTDSTGNIESVLYAAKSRVAPLKNVQTIPKLELCAAALLAKLYITIKKAILFKIDKVFFWTDSTIVLHWINTSPHQLKTFVANRVAQIQSETNSSDWGHVRTEMNPADLLSRGTMPQDFLSPSLWRQGPPWLSKPQEEWPPQAFTQLQDIPEIRQVKCLNATVMDHSIYTRFSSFSKMRRVLARCLRWAPRNLDKGPLTPDELWNAERRIIRQIQTQEFLHEFKDLEAGKALNGKSKLLALSPFLDSDQIVRVGGRLQHANYPYDQRHPILLPKSHHFTRILIEHHHRLTKHGAIQSTLYSVRQKYWIIDGRNQVRFVVRSCMRCSRASPTVPDYIMGSLPSVRTIQVRPFTNVGVDYCGPFYVKEKKLRNKNRVKVYVAIFVCMTTKAVHMEVVSDLTTEAFLAALKRFIARRGICATIYSDNATNFVGANKELKEIRNLLSSAEHNELVQRHLSEHGISWHFSPPHSPHFGGLWEAAVRSFKHHFKRVASNALLTFEQLNTLVIEIEGILNSRPLTPLSSDPNDLLALTPSHFLIGDKLSSIPEQDLAECKLNRLSAWQHIQKMKQDFWTRWHKEYANELNIRRKWTKGEHKISTGSFVLIRDDHTPPLQWCMGRVIAIHPGQDGVVRAATIRTAHGDLKRCIKRLSILPIHTDDDRHRKFN